MEGSVAQIAMERSGFAWLRKRFLKRPVNISKVLALREADKRVEKMHMALDERRRISSLL